MVRELAVIGIQYTTEMTRGALNKYLMCFVQSQYEYVSVVIPCSEIVIPLALPSHILILLIPSFCDMCTLFPS